MSDQLLPEEHLPPAEAPATALPPRPPLPTLSSEDGRIVLTEEALQVNGQRFAMLELEAVEVQRVRWLLWFLLGGFTLAGFLLGLLQNWVRLMPAALGITVGALLLAWGQRGTNRLRLHRLGRETVHFALPGEPTQWQKLMAETNRRIRRRHDEAAEAAALALLAAESAARPPEPPTTE
ncbi:hypothetical protein KBK19_17665 [Microvirga sp. STR05]|uniref:Uncharacterized protein n=1 Tax=Hymenobacter duratus TaxID=2771356 RepID=A0ABR8JMC3_9BACT|nr:hypothetical protein [Hymenobacter duratus]MBD2716876.1 hypothetical protein [Hymenobacter duratus]MBR7951792.1 hypothetical protein [Microvirga sp. STR05]